MDHILPSYWSSGLRTTTANRKAESLFNHVSPQLHVSRKRPWRDAADDAAASQKLLALREHV